MGIRIDYIDDKSEKVLAQLAVDDEEVKALSTNMISTIPEVVFYDWHENAIKNKARKCIDTVVLQYSEYNPEKISVEQKKQIVKDAVIQTAAEREAEREGK